MSYFEVNFDGLVGPTHHYGGLSFGNIASLKHKHQNSNPKEAALQGLEKMFLLHQMGIKQAVLPPHERPNLLFLRRLGYSGTDAEILQTADPELLLASCSSSNMWVANAATMSPSSDSQDKKVHFVPANLCTNLHRCLEANATARILQKIFPECIQHLPLPSTPKLSDEGAANHTRFTGGVHLFVYGKSRLEEGPEKFPARQTLEASQAVARLLQVEKNAIFARQNPEAIDAGVFHNDVISVGFENLFFFHERAFAQTEKVLLDLRKRIKNLIEIRVNEHEIPLEKAVATYLFNSQIVRNRENQLVLIAPIECRENPTVFSFLQKIPIRQIRFVDLKQSMQNGGGPACLRFRVVLSEEEIEKTHKKVFLTNDLYEQLKNWIKTYYREQLSINDLNDVKVLQESREALDALTKILELGSFYDFQKV